MRITVSGDAQKILYELNPLNEDEQYKSGRIFEQYLVDNDGDLLPEGTSVDIAFVLIDDLIQINTTTVSQYGFKEIGSVIDTIYPKGYKPVAYYNIDEIICPVYGSYTEAIGEDGLLTLNINELTSLYEEMYTDLPSGYYRVMYSVGNNEIVGVLRTIYVTE